MICGESTGATEEARDHIMVGPLWTKQHTRSVRNIELSWNELMYATSDLCKLGGM